MPYVGEDVPLINFYTLATSTNAELKEITKKQRQVLLSQNTEPDVSLFTQDVAEPVKEAVAPGLAWFDTWKIPIGIGAVVVGSLVLLGYSGMGKPIGAYAAKKIGEKENVE
jgi:hypothetical protein